MNIPRKIPYEAPAAETIFLSTSLIMLDVSGETKDSDIDPVDDDNFNW